MHEQEGFIPVAGEYRVWYRIAGGGAERENIPLLALHGGPGVPHDYIENLADLASDTRRVILYDQLGCGRSDKPDDTSLWRVDRLSRNSVLYAASWALTGFTCWANRGEVCSPSSMP